jgi:hypothetical protein
MRRLLPLLSAVPLLVAAALLPASPAHAAYGASGAAAPKLTVHAIFSGGQATHFHVGQVLQAVVRNSGGQRLTSVCWSPAPIGRPACSAAVTGAPSATGPLTVTATLSDQSTLTVTANVLAPATKVGGPRMVPSHITCRDVGLFGNYSPTRHRSYDLAERMTTGTQVGTLNRIGPGKIFMWDYATAKAGFASERCATPGLG